MARIEWWKCRVKPTLESLLALFRRHQGTWLNHAVCYEAGGHRTTARVMELRRMGHRVSQEGQGENSRYRYDGPPDLGYKALSCVCGWDGNELSAIGWHCPRCGKEAFTDRLRENEKQVVLL